MTDAELVKLVKLFSVLNGMEKIYLLEILNLETSEYASNLCQYLDQSRSVTNLTMSDLRNVLIGLSHTEDMASMPNETNVQTSSLNSYSKPNNEFKCGEHMVAVWHDDKANCLEWYLGVVDSVDEDSVVVSYMKGVTSRMLDGCSQTKSFCAIYKFRTF